MTSEADIYPELTPMLVGLKEAQWELWRTYKTPLQSFQGLDNIDSFLVSRHTSKQAACREAKDQFSKYPMSNFYVVKRTCEAVVPAHAGRPRTYGIIGTKLS